MCKGHQPQSSICDRLTSNCLHRLGRGEGRQGVGKLPAYQPQGPGDASRDLLSTRAVCIRPSTVTIQTRSLLPFSPVYWREKLGVIPRGRNCNQISQMEIAAPTQPCSVANIANFWTMLLKVLLTGSALIMESF